MFNVLSVSIILTALLFSQSFGEIRCGTISYAENQKNPVKRKTAALDCNPESLYGTVHNRQTEHFIIYYTTEGSHRIKTLAYIDSLAKYLEQAYKLHKDSLGMKGILRGESSERETRHYRQKVPRGFYPVEVIDTGLLRGDEGEYQTTFGLVFYFNRNSRETQMAIENDFLYGADCYGKPSTIPLTSTKNGDYSVNWPLALKVTVFHELYHSFQLTQFDLARYDSFWLEASASGVEEIGAPEVDDYLSYLSKTFRNTGVSLESLPAMEQYGYATLYLFLFSELGSRFDSEIWNNFSTHRYDKFSAQLKRVADSRGLDVEDLFHKYVSQVFYSGQKADVSPYILFWSDMPSWPEWKIDNGLPSTSFQLPTESFRFVKISDGYAPSTNALRKSILDSANSDGFSIWAISRLQEKEPEPPDGKLIAYPNPWRPKQHGKVTFDSLPRNSTGIEIRSSNGALLTRIKTDTTFVEWEPKKIPAPGILYYRALPHGKNKVLILQY